MDDSDDYPFDEIVLDDQTLAILEQSEQKYLQERAQVAVPPILPSERVSKRLKMSNGWIPGTGGRFTHEDEDDLPEISLQGDGSYGVNSRTTTIQSTLSRAAPPAIQSTRPSALTKNRGQSQTSYQHTQQLAFRAPSSRQAFATNNRTQQRVQNIQELNQDRGLRNGDEGMQNSAQLAQMAELQKKLDELREENTKMKASLQDAIDLKLAKEGEVSILRKSIEKNAQNHTTQIFQLKAEKEKTDARQAQMQKELKDEMERLRTQFVFRQQEHEASIRKPPGSVRAKKSGRDFPSTPLAVPPAMQGWNKGISEGSGFRKPVEETPLRPSRLPSVSKASPTKSRKSPEKVKTGMLPGFENAFETSTPRRSPSKRKDKGKMPVVQDTPVFDLDAANTLRPFSQLSRVPSQFQLEPIHIPSQPQESQPQELFALPGFSGPFIAQEFQQKNEDMDIVLVESDDDLVPEEIETIDPINWKAELCRIILTHSYGLRGEISFQQLLTLSHPVNSTHYSTSCARILEVISNSTKFDDYDDSINIVSVSLLSILVTLSETQQLLPLTILLNLLTKLVISLPKLRSTLLSCRICVSDNPALSIVDIVCTTTSKYLQPMADHPHRDELAAETLSLLESVCFNTTIESTESLKPLARNREVLMILSHAAQPHWLLEGTFRLLVLLSTYHDMHKILLDIPDGGMDFGNDIQTKDALFEQLCSHLLDSRKSPVENLKIYILTYFAQLSISHSASHGALGTSYTLIPSLVIYVSQLITPLWEDDGSLASSSESTSSLVQALNQATFLLYHLIFGIEPNLNLRHKLQHAPHRSFNSISHIFVVTFGRLSYCEPPSWMEVQIRQELEFLAEISREILEVVVDGPEGDSVWAAFQTEPDEESIIDEEEMEAQLMGVDA